MWIYSDRPPWLAPLSVADYRAIDEQQTSFSQLAGYQTTTVTLTGNGTASRVNNRNVVVAQARTVAHLAESPAAQLNLIRFAELALGRASLDLPGSETSN